MMHVAVGRLEVTVSMAERARERLAERQPASRRAAVQRAYEQERAWRAVERDRAAWDAGILMQRSRTLR